MSEAGGPTKKGGQRSKSKTREARRPNPSSSESSSGQTQQLDKKMAQLSVSGDKSAQVPLFPRMPPRQPNARHPGDPVALISNLFRISIKSEKPIFKYSVEIDFDKSEGKAAEGVEKVPRRIRGDLARAVLEKTMVDYVRKIKLPVPNGYNYCFDLPGKNLITLFDMFPKPTDGKKKEYSIEIDLPTIVDNSKVQDLPQRFKVVIFKGSQFLVKEALEYCGGKVRGKAQDYQEHLGLINTIMRARIISIPSNFCTNANTFPFKKENIFPLSPGVQLNQGFYSSAKLTQTGLVLNVHNAFNAFTEVKFLTDLLVERFRVRDLSRVDPATIKNLLKEVQKKQVEATHINYGTKDKPHYRKYRVEDIRGCSRTDKFTLVDKITKVSKEVTVQDYFFQEYKTKLKYPNLPCVIDKGRKIPLELCRLVEKQKVMRKMTPDETATIIKKAALKPEATFKHITQNVLEIQRESKPLKDFGLDLDGKPIEVEGYELLPLSLVGKTGRPLNPRDGQYDNRKEPFVTPATVNKCILAFIVDQARDRNLVHAINNNQLGVDVFSQNFINQGAEKGVKMPKAVIEHQKLFIVGEDKDFKALLKRFVGYCNTSKADHAIFILPPSCPDYVYRYLQYLEATVQEGRKPPEKFTRISCIKYENYDRKIINDRNKGAMFLSNLWLKYNTKLGGVNYVLDSRSKYPFLSEGWLFIAVDVCHPAPGDKLIQSVAAAIGMWDLTSSNLSYCTRLRVQKKTGENGSTTREDVAEIDVMVNDILNDYRAKKNLLPKYVVILRDGVSEGQFEIVLQKEVHLVKKCLLQAYGKSPQPKLACLVVQKRHKVRFQRKVPKVTSRGDQDYNMQPGTVVDSVVVHPNDFSFYLAPHKTIQGTTRPVHAYMILDEIGFSQDVAQAMIHALSYLSPRCNKSTSIPTPINLADRAAERGKNIVISWNDDNPGKMSDQDRLNRLNDLLSNKLGEKNYKNTLYYI